jgi:hypothetical protein
LVTSYRTLSNIVATHYFHQHHNIALSQKRMTFQV